MGNDIKKGSLDRIAQQSQSSSNNESHTGPDSGRQFHFEHAMDWFQQEHGRKPEKHEIQGINDMADAMHEFHTQHAMPDNMGKSDNFQAHQGSIPQQKSTYTPVRLNPGMFSNEAREAHLNHAVNWFKDEYNRDPQDHEMEGLHDMAAQTHLHELKEIHGKSIDHEVAPRPLPKSENIEDNIAKADVKKNYEGSFGIGGVPKPKEQKQKELKTKIKNIQDDKRKQLNVKKSMIGGTQRQVANWDMMGDALKPRNAAASTKDYSKQVAEKQPNQPAKRDNYHLASRPKRVNYGTFKSEEKPDYSSNADKVKSRKQEKKELKTDLKDRKYKRDDSKADKGRNDLENHLRDINRDEKHSGKRLPKSEDNMSKSNNKVINPEKYDPKLQRHPHPDRNDPEKDTKDDGKTWDSKNKKNKYNPEKEGMEKGCKKSESGLHTIEYPENYGEVKKSYDNSNDLDDGKESQTTKLANKKKKYDSVNDINDGMRNKKNVSHNAGLHKVEYPTNYGTTNKAEKLAPEDHIEYDHSVCRDVDRNKKAQQVEDRIGNNRKKVNGNFERKSNERYPGDNDQMNAKTEDHKKFKKKGNKRVKWESEMPNKKSVKKSESGLHTIEYPENYGKSKKQ